MNVFQIVGVVTALALGVLFFWGVEKGYLDDVYEDRYK